MVMFVEDLFGGGMPYEAFSTYKHPCHNPKRWIS